MDNAKKLEMLEEIFDLDAGTLTEQTKLEELSQWDSMAKLSLIVLANDDFGKKLGAAQIKEFVTVGDILNFLG